MALLGLILPENGEHLVYGGCGADPVHQVCYKLLGLCILEFDRLAVCIDLEIAECSDSNTLPGRIGQRKAQFIQLMLDLCLSDRL